MSFFLLDFIDILFGIFLLYGIVGSQRNRLFSFVFILPSHVLRESVRFIVGMLLCAKPREPHFFPKNKNNALYYEKLQYQNINCFNSFFVCFAPLLGVALLFYLKDSFFFFGLNSSLFSYFYIYIFSVIFLASLPLRQDIESFFSHPYGVILYISILIVGIFIFEKECMLWFNSLIDFLKTKAERIYF